MWDLGKAQPLLRCSHLKGVGKNVYKSEAVRRPHWLIVNYDDLYMRVFTISSRGGQALAVFGSEEDAETFLDSRLGSSGQRWRVRQTSVGELISVLYGLAQMLRG
jgi:hypothetical protein